ncbi:MAG TPA: hypothetical protein VLV50_06815 [Stellaceae bacterium]|nr:hypothetical protein [Stellaceae bacterium]
MIINVTEAGAAELLERDDFKNFKIAVAPSAAAPAALARALQGIATLEPDGKTAWVKADALRTWQGRAQPTEWVTSFDKMVESVRRFGWVREDGTVRAHIEVKG